MPRILIIDDDETIRHVLGKALEQAGFEVALAVDGRDGTQKFRSAHYDLVIVDIWMPEKDGLETLMEIRRNTPHAKVIAMSGGGQRGLMQPLNWAQQLGAVAALTKPFTAEELLAVIRTTLGTSTP